MSIRAKFATMVGASLLALVVAVSAAALTNHVAFAQDATTDQAATPQSRASDFLDRLAGALGIETDQLQSAITDTRLQMVDEAEASGELTADQAQRARDRINGGEGYFFLERGMRGMRHGTIKGELMDAAAAYFGIDTDQLRQDLQESGTLQAVAATYGKDTTEGKAGLESAMEDALRQLLEDNGMSQDRIDQRVTVFEQRFDQLYTATNTRGMGGPGCGPEPNSQQEPSQATPTGAI